MFQGLRLKAQDLRLKTRGIRLKASRQFKAGRVSGFWGFGVQGGGLGVRAVKSGVRRLAVWLGAQGFRLKA